MAPPHREFSTLLVTGSLGVVGDEILGPKAVLTNCRVRERHRPRSVIESDLPAGSMAQKLNHSTVGRQTNVWPQDYVNLARSG
jgi:hypothetical protein